MNADLKQKWITSLKSGEYEQCFGSLNCGGCQCALGVLLLVANVKPSGKQGKYILYDNYTSFVSLSLRDKLGITLEQFEVITHLNDVLTWSFEQIADYIEENF